jgi:hypothetical protein
MSAGIIGKTGKTDPTAAIDSPRNSETVSQSASTQPVQEPALPAEDAPNLETLLEQASGPDCVRFIHCYIKH